MERLVELSRPRCILVTRYLPRGLVFVTAKERLDRPVLMVTQDQNTLGFDCMTDRAERRGYPVLHVLKRLNGIDCEHLSQAAARRLDE